MVCGNRTKLEIRRAGLPVLLVIVALLVATCGATAEPSNGNADPAGDEPSVGAPASSPDVTPTLIVEASATQTPAATLTATLLPTATVDAGAGGGGGQDGPMVAVENQAIQDGRVVVQKVISNGAGWIVILADAEGKPGAVVGYGPVTAGENKDVVVAIDVSRATPTLYAMLHTEAGEPGFYEFPGPDGPVEVNGQVVSPAFAVEGIPERTVTGDATAPANLHDHSGSAGGSSGTPAPQATPGSEVRESNALVVMRNYQFSPRTITVRAGTTVTWVNRDAGVMHNVESDEGVWHSELFGTGEAFSFVFDEPGTYTYHCHPHGNVGGVGMAGTVIVVP